MTTTNAISAQSIGTGANVGNRLFPQKITIATGSTAYVVTANLTVPDAATIDLSTNLRVWYSSSSFSVTAAEGAARLGTTARYVDVIPNLEPRLGLIAIRDGSLEVLTGQYIYLWCQVPTFRTAGTLSVNVTELP